MRASGMPDHFRRARRVQSYAQGVGIRQPYILRRGDDQPSSYKADILPGFQHHTQPIQGGVRVRARAMDLMKAEIVS